MSTPYDAVYARFLNKIRDYPIIKQIEDENGNKGLVERLLYRCLNGAIANFTYESSKVSDRDDEEKKFNGALSDTEMEILAKFMVVEYLNPYLISSDKIENNLSSKDFRSYSPANLMRQLGEIQDRERDQATQLMVENYYRSGSL